MEWDLVTKAGTLFEFDDKVFYDLAVGPHPRRAVVCGVGVLHPRYGFIWYYTRIDGKAPFGREDAAKILIAQWRYSLIDYRSLLLPQGKLTNTGDEIGWKHTHKILENASNRSCSDREYSIV